MRSSIQRNILLSTGLLALVITTHLQTLRVFFPSVAWYLKDTIGVDSTTMASVVMIVMTVGFFAALLKKLLSVRVAVLLTSTLISLTRILEQLVTVASADLWISMIGCGTFALFLPIFIAHIRAKGPRQSSPILAYGLFLGLALDSLIHGFTSTLDLSWIPGWLPILIVIIQGLWIVGLAAYEFYTPINKPSETSWRENLPFIALGPFLFLQGLIFQNQGWVSELSGIPGEWGFVFVQFGNVITIFSIYVGHWYQEQFRPTSSLATGFLIPALSILLIQPGPIFLPTLLILQALFGWSWGYMASRTVIATRRGLGRTTFMTTSGLLLFILLTFLYYAGLDLSLPFYREAILPTAAVIYSLTFLGVSLQAQRPTKKIRSMTEPLIVSGSFLLLALLHLIFNPPPPKPDAASGNELNIMTYNIHSAYNIDGRQDPESIAQVIIENNADIVAIQEISRGWLINGSTDLTSWLSQRLEMQVIFKGTTGPMWGNAILSRFPILQFNSGMLPALGRPLERGYIHAEIEIGNNQSIHIFATHLHHVESESIVRHAQLIQLINIWDDLPHSILLGDLNARPFDPEIELLHRAGFSDAWSGVGQGEGYTFNSREPSKRIDWIWHTADLVVLDAQVPNSTASDHLPVIITTIPHNQ